MARTVKIRLSNFSMNLSDNTVLVTGASSGIGYALALRLAQLNNTVIAVGRHQARLNELQSRSARIHSFCADLADKQQLEQLALWVEENHPGLNVLINNAGIQYNYTFAESRAYLYQIEHEINVNLTAPLQLTALLLPTLVGKQAAAIVNISSGLALAPKQSAPVYCGTKAGLHIFTKALRYQLETTAVRVIEVIPPLVDTPMTAGRGKNKVSPERLVDEFLSGFARNQPEINIGKVGLLRTLLRLSPSLADSLLKNG